MPTLYITEYQQLAVDGRGIVPAGVEPALASQTVAIGAGSAQSSPFGERTRFVRVHTDAACSVKFGANPTAAATDARMAASQTEFFGVVPGHRLAVITNT